MSAQNSITKDIAEEGKGKGKAVEDTSMETGDDSSSEDEVDEDAPVVDEDDLDNMEEIDTENIINDGRRTRGRIIDFKKANEELGEDNEDDEDDDFEEPQEDEDSKMHE